MSKRKASPKPTSTSTGKTVKKLRPTDFSSSLMNRFKPQMKPTDFGQEIADLSCFRRSRGRTPSISSNR